MKQIRNRLTYANVMSSLAVFLILGGATAFAAIKKVGANEIKANSIKTGKIVKEAVTAGKLKKGAVTESRIADGAVTTNKIADNAVTTAKIANDAVTGDKVKESTLGAVPNSEKLGGLGSTAFVGTSELLWALIDADVGTASVVRSRGATGASSPGTGRYVVTFNRNITTCGIVATLGDATAETGSPGEISLDQPEGNAVEVNTYSSAGAPEDQLETNGFYLQVTC